MSFSVRFFAWMVWTRTRTIRQLLGGAVLLEIVKRDMILLNILLGLLKEMCDISWR